MDCGLRLARAPTISRAWPGGNGTLGDVKSAHDLGAGSTNPGRLGASSLTRSAHPSGAWPSSPEAGVDEYVVAGPGSEFTVSSPALSRQAWPRSSPRNPRGHPDRDGVGWRSM